MMRRGIESHDHFLIVNQSLKTILKISNGKNNYLSNLTFGSNGETIAADEIQGIVKVWDTHSGKILFTISHFFLHPVDFVKFSSTGDKILIIQNQNIIVCDGKCGALLKSWKMHSQARRAVFSESSSLLAVSYDDNKLRIWKNEKMTLAKTFMKNISGSHGIFSPVDRELLLSVVNDSDFRLMNLKAGKIKEIPGLKGHQVTKIAFSSDGQKFASGSEKGEICVWELKTGSLLKKWLAFNKLHVLMIDYMASDLIYTESIEETANIKIWDPQNFQLIKSFRFINGKNKKYSNIVPSTHGPYLAGSNDDDNSLHLLDIQANNKESIFLGHIARINFLGFSASKKQLISCGEENVIRIWEIATCHTIQVVNCEKPAYNCFYPIFENALFFTISDSYYLWNLQSNQLIKKVTPQYVEGAWYVQERDELQGAMGNALVFFETNTGLEQIIWSKGPTPANIQGVKGLSEEDQKVLKIIAEDPTCIDIINK